MNRIRRPRPRATFRALAPTYVPVSEPRPDASKIVAAQKRARPAPDVAATPRASLRPYVLPIAIVSCVLVAALIFTRLPSVPTPTALQITPITAPTTVPAVPTEAPEPLTTILAYAAPEGAVLGPIETTRTMHAVAHFGGAWIQADVEGSGLVWLKKNDVDLAIVGPDLAPHIAAVDPQQTGQGLTLYRAPVQPQIEQTILEKSPAEPTIAPTAIVWPTSAPAKSADFTPASPAGTCAFIGCLPGSGLAQQSEEEQRCHALYEQYGDVDADAIADEGARAAAKSCIWEGFYK